MIHVEGILLKTQIAAVIKIKGSITNTELAEFIYSFCFISSAKTLSNFTHIRSHMRG